MELNSKICTSVEQSKRLLKRGLKKETADCYLFEYDKEKYKVIAESWSDLIADTEYYSQHKDVCHPAWSLHRLMEIGEMKDIEFSNISKIYDTAVRVIECYIHAGFINTEYLEETICQQD